MAADSGAAVTGQEEVQEVLDFHALKLKAYHKLIGRLQKHAAQLLVHDREIRRQAGLQDEGRKAPPVVLETPECPSRHCFTTGIGLDLQALPPACVVHNIPSDDCRLTDPNMLHIFWNGLRWRHEEAARPTTWLELFGLYSSPLRPSLKPVRPF